ncbi:MAG: hypothetical protein Q8P20_05760 [bacterium]|nr:hypothetical protein [bacterium]
MAEIFYSAVWQYKEFPFFSFLYNGGSMLIQDPQGHLLSITTPVILLFGPQIGLRFMALIWGTIGWLSCFNWLKPKIGYAPALISASAWVLSLGFIWRMVIGNDMFLWHLGLPLFLILIEKIFKKPSPIHVISLGLLSGMYLLGPSFHSLLYFIIPVCLIWLIFLLQQNKEKNKKHNNAKIFLCLLTALILGLLISAPKINSWVQLDMSRPTDPGGNIYFVEALQALIDVRPENLNKLFISKTEGSYYFLEGNVALPPLATLLAIIGILFSWKLKKRTGYLYIFSMTLLITGVLISTNSYIWDLFGYITNHNFRIAARFLSISAFGLAILAGLGAKMIIKKLPKITTWFTIVIILSFFLNGIIWLNNASHLIATYKIFERNLVLPPTVLWDKNQPWIESAVIDTIQDGMVIYNDFAIVGSGVKDYDMEKIDSLIDNYGLENFFSPELWPDRLSFSHTVLNITELKPHETAQLRFNMPELGYDIAASPHNAHISLTDNNEGIIIKNHEDFIVKNVTITPHLPIKPTSWFISIFTIILLILYAMIIKIYHKYGRKIKEKSGSKKNI